MDDNIEIIDYDKNNQIDWNQTIMVKFNILSIGIDSPILLKVPEKFRSIINSLYFYKFETNSIGDKFNVEFISSNDDFIYVSDNILLIENFN